MREIVPASKSRSGNNHFSWGTTKTRDYTNYPNIYIPAFVKP